MAFPIRICAICSEEFELRPDKPGFANRCPSCSVEEDKASAHRPENQRDSERDTARRTAIRDLLYRKDG
jgi:hypothetical protein